MIDVCERNAVFMFESPVNAIQQHSGCFFFFKRNKIHLIEYNVHLMALKLDLNNWLGYLW